MVAGIDFDTYKVTVAGIRYGDPVTMFTIRLRKDSESGEMRGLLALREMEPLLVAHDDFWKECDTIFVERAFGGSRRSDFALGAVFGGLMTILPAICDAEVNPLTLAEWRREIGLPGNAPKAMVLPRLRELGYGPNLSGDEADALAIAHAGRSLLLRGVPA